MSKPQPLTEPAQPDTLEELLAALEKDGADSSRRSGAMRKFLEVKARKQGVPLHGMFELTPFCNLDCKMCYVHLTKEQTKGKELLTVEQWKSLMTEAAQAGMLDAALTGGECLTYPGFDELYLHLHSLGVEVSVLTNGLLLTEERVRFFQQHPIRKLQITLYGASEDEYEAVTGSRCFEKVMVNIQLAKEARLPLVIAITPNRFMLDGGEALVRLVDAFGLSYTINNCLFAPQTETGRTNIAIDMETEDYIKLYVLRRELSGKRIVLNEGCELPPTATQTDRVTRGLRCAAGHSNFEISWDGQMTPCGMIREIAVDPLKMGFQAAWDAVHREAMQYPIPSECEGCAYRLLCPSCVKLHESDASPGHASPRICLRAQKLVTAGVVSLSGLV